MACRFHHVWLQFVRRCLRFVAAGWRCAARPPIVHAIDTGTAGSPQAKEHTMNIAARQLSRVTTIAAVLAAVIVTGFATPSAHAAGKEVRVVQLQPVVVVGKRVRVIELEPVVIVAKRLTPAPTVIAQRSARATRV
jgi:hypothetical protein